MIDLHCHLLPGIDDGPKRLDASVALGRALAAAGVTQVVATPHVHWDYPDNAATGIADAVGAVQGALDTDGVALTVLAGAEVALTRATDLPAAELDQLHLAASPWLLVECPFTGSSAGYERALVSLADRGHRILIAHPERIAGFAQDRELLRRLVDDHAMACQVTAGSLAGGFGREVQRFAWWLLEQRLLHVVASDAHSLDRRPPGTVEPLRAAGVEESWIEALALTMPAALLAGEELPALPVRAPRPSGLRGRFKRAS